jgi:pimeloyl-ACP methyl ester carboxylesterase
VEGVSHRWVRARGLDFHVAEAGSGDDVVLCLHGWPQHWYEWRHLLPALADRHRVLASDVLAVLVSGSARKEAWDSETLNAFAANLAEPERARAAVQLYRTFQLRELPRIMRGHYREQRLTVPTRMLFGIEDVVLRPELLAGYERHADDMEVELVRDSGHFIADERPELVAERARELFASGL